MQNKSIPPDRVSAYFRAEWLTLTLVTVSGLLYNVGLLAGPWFEGRLAQCLLEILNGEKGFAAMAQLAAWYVAVIAAVQAARCVKRFYVRRFANNVNRRMKKLLYQNLLRKSCAELSGEGEGSMLTKAISDVDDCAEGMRKFTTELFDTGVALAAYIAMLLWYDARLALLCLVFPPVSYFIAEKMKRVVQRTGALRKEQAARLSDATLDRAANAITYRVYGCEAQRAAAYEQSLSAYEKAAVSASVWSGALPPLYQVISMAGTLFILYFGTRSVAAGVWNIAAFTTFLSCFAKLSVKSSKAAKLFNSVHKAQVSWKRIRPFLRPVAEEPEPRALPAAPLCVQNLSFAYPGGAPVFENLSFTARPGQIIGITGPVACGKSTLGKAFLCETPYGGSITFGGRELSALSAWERRGIVGYLGHDPELLSDTIENNIRLGGSAPAEPCLAAVSLAQEVAAMENGRDTRVGSGGVRLSGGQAQRLALARTLYHTRPLLILDDPFSALDRATEAEIFARLRRESAGRIVLLFSHRLYLFPQTDAVIWMENGSTVVSTHEQLQKAVPQYAQLYSVQKGDAGHETKYV